MSKAIKAGLWYTLSNMLIKSIGIITAPIFTRLLTTADYGKINNFISWQSILIIFWGLGLEYSIGRAKLDFNTDFSNYTSSILSLSFIGGIIMSFIFLLFAEPLSAFMEIDRSLLISLCVALLFSPPLSLYQTKLRFEYKYKRNVLFALYNAVLVTVLSIIFILLSDLGNQYKGKIYGTIIPIVGLGIISTYYIYKQGGKLDTQYWKYAVKYSLPMIPHGLGMLLLSQIDRIMIIKLDTDSGAGIYSFGYSLAVILLFLFSSVVSAWQPWLFDNLKLGNRQAIHKSVKVLNAIFLSLFLLMATLGPEVIKLLGSRDFWVAQTVIIPIATGIFYQFVYSYFFNIELYYKKVIFIPIGTISAAIINIALNALLLPQYGYIAASYTTMVSYFLLMLYHWLVYLKIDQECTLPTKSLLLFTLLGTGLGLVMQWLINAPLYRYMIGASIISVTIYVYRTPILSYIKSKRNEI